MIGNLGLDFSHFFQNKRCGYLLESPRRGGSRKHPQFMPLALLNEKFLNNFYQSYI